MHKLVRGLESDLNCSRSSLQSLMNESLKSLKIFNDKETVKKETHQYQGFVLSHNLEISSNSTGVKRMYQPIEPQDNQNTTRNFEETKNTQNMQILDSMVPDNLNFTFEKHESSRVSIMSKKDKSIDVTAGADDKEILKVHELG